MAQLLSPVCADSLFKSRSLCPSFSRWRTGVRNGPHSLNFGWRRRDVSLAAVAGESSSTKNDVADDYYAVLGVMPDATPQQIKKAYYNCMKSCHPDLSGDDPDVTNFCMFINDVYEVLSDPVQRMVYDEIHGYALTAINPFLDDTATKDHAFVDEFSCIGCKNCANICADVFRIEEDFGRARVHCQSGNPNLITEAIESCPVDCIHWTSAAQVSLLEDEMRRVERVNVGLMLSGMGSSVDVFRMASSRWERRQSKVLEKARASMVKQKDSKKAGSWTGSWTGSWSDVWGKPNEYPKTTEEEAKERAKRTAAAARRWREYSRKGADRRPTFKLPEAMSSKDK